MPQPTAIWNPARDAWELPNTESLLCGHSDVYSETWPTSGTTRNGVACALPTWAPRTAGSASSSSPDDDDLLGTPTSRMWKGAGPQGGPTQIRNKARGLIEAQVMDLLPTPAASVMNDGEDVAHWDERRERIKAKGINGNGMGEPLTIAAQRLLPTPRATDGTKGGPNQRGSSGDMMQPSAACQLLPTPAANLGEHRRDSGQDPEKRRAKGRQVSTADVACHEIQTDWGPYAPAIRRWERVLEQPAPPPTEPNKAGKPRLSPRFTEWMMGVPAGWITDTPGVSRNDQLKASGNGVVPQQAAAALRDMLAAFEEKEAAA